MNIICSLNSKQDYTADRGFLKILTASLLVVTLFVVSFLSSNAVASDSGLNTIGQGTYTWWGIKIYDAKLRSTDSFSGDYKSHRPIELTITYDIDIDKDDLMETTMDEWASLKIGQSEYCSNKKDWSRQLLSIWPNLKQGDSLTVHVAETNRSAFSYNGKAIGNIEDPRFANCFLSIWLAEDTSAKSLRKKLLNIKR